MVSLSEGDLAGARRVLHLATEVAPEDLAAFMTVGEDLGWVLDDVGQRLALSLGPEEFDGDRAVWGIVRAQIHAWRGDTAKSRTWADTAHRHYTAQLRATPNDALRHLFQGLALAYLGRRAQAIASGKRGVEMKPVRAHTYRAHQLARIYMLVGERERALDQLESLMKVPYYLTPAWLHIDPSFAPLRGHPRFEKLTAVQ